MTANEERDLQAQLAPVGLPDDLPEVALAGEPVPDAAALGRIKRRALARVAAEGAEVKAAGAATAGTASTKAPQVRRPRRWGWSVAAVVALLALTVTAVVDPDQVRAYVGRFIPGLGLSDRTGIRLAAAAPVRSVRGDARVEVLGLVLDEKGGWLSLVAEHVPLFDKTIWLEDAVGRLTPLAYSSRSGSDRSFHGWYQVPANLPAPENRLTVVIRDAATPWRLEVPLVPADQLPALDQFGPSASLHGLTLTGRAIDLGDRTAVDVLVQEAPEGARVISLGLDWLQRPVKLEAGGRAYGLTLQPVPTLQLWQYDAGPLPAGTETVTLTIPAIEVREDTGAQVRLDVVSGPVDETLNIGYHLLRITKTEVTAEGLKVFVEPRPGLGARPGLAAWTELRVNGEMTSWMHHRDEQTGLMDYFVIPVPEGARTVTVNIFQPEVLIEGPWVIEVPVTR